MAESTDIGWTSATMNFWLGCAKVSEACRICYMFRWAKRVGRDPLKVVRTSAAKWREPYQWQRELDAIGGDAKRLVFTCSLSDFFIHSADPWRSEAWKVVRETPRLTYQVLTKRPARIPAALPSDWGPDGYPNVWLGTSCETQRWADVRIPFLLKAKAPVRFLSCEPLLGPIDLTRYLGDGRINWVIVGGESGFAEDAPVPMRKEWAHQIREDCERAGVPFFFKQGGGTRYCKCPRCLEHSKVGVWGCRLLDGEVYDDIPFGLDPKALLATA